MCGKFTAMFSYAEVVAFNQPLSSTADDKEVTYRVVNELPVVVLNIVENKRQVVRMRWGFPDAKDWRRPKPIHARSETVDTTKAFAQAFADGQRGIVLMKTFNEAPDVPGPTIQHTITPPAGKGIGCSLCLAQVRYTGRANAAFCARPVHGPRKRTNSQARHRQSDIKSYSSRSQTTFFTKLNNRALRADNRRQWTSAKSKSSRCYCCLPSARAAWLLIFGGRMESVLNLLLDKTFLLTLFLTLILTSFVFAGGILFWKRRFKALYIMVAATLCGSVIFLLLRGMFGGGTPMVQAREQSQIPMSEVLIANESLKPGAVITSDNFRWQKWPTSSVDSTFVTHGAVGSEASLNGLFVTVPIAPGQPLATNALSERPPPPPQAPIAMYEVTYNAPTVIPYERATEYQLVINSKAKDVEAFNGMTGPQLRGTLQLGRFVKVVMTGSDPAVTIDSKGISECQEISSRSNPTWNWAVTPKTIQPFTLHIEGRSIGLQGCGARSS
jgi:hypothetical protein